jgi:hypothetical protein
MQAGQGYEFSKTSSNPGDEQAKARWEQFEKLDRARKAYEAAKKRLSRAEHERSSASCEVSNTARALERERLALDKLTAIAPEDVEQRGEPIPTETP